MDKTFHLTQNCIEKLSSELEQLVKVERVKIAKMIKEAREHGDLRENADYQAAKEAQSFIETRIQKIQHLLKHARPLEKNSWDGCCIKLGTCVELEDMDTGLKVSYSILHPEEADPVNGLISHESPIGKALLEKKAGDTVEITIPRGILNYRITEVSWHE